MPPMQISSLGKSSGGIKKKKPVKKAKGDDLFASMGLAAKPSFNKPVGRPTSSTTGSSVSKWKMTALEDTGDTQWDDDGDLDDLLND